MSNDKYTQAVLRPIAWAIGTLILIVLASVLIFPLSTERRFWLILLLTLYGIFSAWVIYSSRSRPWNTWLTAFVGLVSVFVIALCDYLLATIDLSPLYVIAIIIIAVIANRRTALFIALAASVFQTTSAIFNGNSLGFGSGIPLHILVNLLAALLVAELADAATSRLREAVVQTDRQRREIEQRKNELEGLHQIAQTFAQLEDATATFREVSKRIAQLLGAQFCILARLERQGRYVRAVPPGFGLTDEQIAGFSYAVTPEIVALWDIGKDEWFLLSEASVLPGPLRELANELRIRQMVGARMMWRGHPTGMVFVANKRDGAPFEEKDARLLSILAGQAAVAVENAQLYRQVQSSLQDVTRLYAISAQLLEQHDPAEIPDRVVKAVAEALSAPMASIALLNETTGLLEYAATLGVPENMRRVPFRQEGVGMTVVRTGKARFVEEVLAAQDVNPVVRQWGYRAVACLPISHGAKRIGALYVNYAEPHPFSEIEQNVLATFANQTAIALENARLLRAEQHKSLELAALSNLSKSLAETMNLEEMFRVIERQVRTSMPAADSGALLLFDAMNHALVPRASFGFATAVVQKLALQPGESIPGQVFKARQGLIYSGIEAVKQARASMRPENQTLFAAASQLGVYPKSVIGAPMNIGGDTLGVIVLDNFQSAESFTPDDLRFLEALADRAALAIRNAQLYENGMRRAAQLSVVAEVGHRVTSILDLDELTHTLVRLAHTRFGYRYVHLFVVDTENRQAILRAGSGPGETQSVAEPLVIPWEQGMVGWVATHGQTLLANDVAQESRFLFHPSVPDTRAELTIPLKIGNQIIGVLDVQSERLNAFEPSDVATLETLAGQVAIALDNARLYGDLREQARRDSLTQAYNHGYFLERLNEEVERAWREGRPLAFIMLDVDFFKTYNDTYGHTFGDLVLGAIVQAIRAHVKHTDLVGRWGGEEFCIALLNADTAHALAVAERIRKTVAMTQFPQKDAAPIPAPTVSQGIAGFPKNAGTAARLIDVADAALYRAKERGRDQVCVAGEC